MPKQIDNRLKCSFCGKSQDQVKKLIAGPGVYVCNECVGLCNEILTEESFKSGNSAAPDETAPLDRKVPFFSSKLPHFVAMRKDQWRGSPIGQSDEKHVQLTEAAINSLENLINYYNENGLEGGVEPFFRALLCLKEKILGSDNAELVPILGELAEFYQRRGDLSLSASLLEWILEIGQVSQKVDDGTLKNYSAKLVKAYLRLGRNQDAEAIVDALFNSETTNLQCL